MQLFLSNLCKASLSLVNVASVSANLATFFQAKHREGVHNHFPLHVGLHFRRDCAGSSFSRTPLFDAEVLVRVIAASHEDLHLTAQLSIAKAFTLHVFQGARNPDRKASSGQDSGGVLFSALYS